MIVTTFFFGSFSVITQTDVVVLLGTLVSEVFAVGIYGNYFFNISTGILGDGQSGINTAMVMPLIFFTWPQVAFAR